METGLGANSEEECTRRLQHGLARYLGRRNGFFTAAELTRDELRGERWMLGMQMRIMIQP
jgi:hypothetical protein